MTTVDPATFEVVWHRLLDVTEEMGIKYMRTSGSPILVGAYDASTAICLPDGQLVAMGPYITTQAHVVRRIVEATIRMRSGHPGIHAGDMFICNDPYLGATHQPDVATVAPVFHGGELRAWVAASGHWLDIGGPEPGGFNMNATTVFDEGLRLPPTRLVDGGMIREDLVELIMAQVREPLAELDLRGQIVANQAGAERLAAIYDEFGVDTVEAVMRGSLDHVERRLRARLATIPDGTWREVQYLDHDGHRPNTRKIVCTATKRGDQLTLDFTGSDPASASFANCAFGALRAAALSGVCVTLAYDVPWNDGVARCVDIVAPPGTIVTAGYPMPVSMSTISAVIVTLNLVMGTLSKMLLVTPGLADEAMAGWCGTSIGVSITGRNDRGRMTVCPEASHFAAGCGARTMADGVDTGGIIINTTANIPSIEQTEAEYPVLYHFRRQLRDSGGAGRFRGGMSAGVAISPYDQRSAMESSFSGVGAEIPNAYGLGGGLPGATVRYLRWTGAGEVADLARDGLPADVADVPGARIVRPVNSSHNDFPPDAVEYHNWQGGGGFGDPLDRDPELVLADVRNEAVSEGAAATVYGVVFGPDGVDAAATAATRERIRAARLVAGRPAAEILDAGVTPPAGAAPAEVLRYGDVVEFDPTSDEVRCIRCATVLGSARADFKLGCLLEETPTTGAGPIRGEDYATAAILRRFHCPGCGRQLEAEVTVPGAPRASFALVGAA
jgi:N-methylhydantoinase B